MNPIDKFLQEQVLFESSCGEFNGYYVYVNSKDAGNIPHFHMKDIETDGKKFHTCIQLDKNNYFLHEGKTSIINDGSLRKDLNSFLKRKPVFFLLRFHLYQLELN